MVSRYRTIARFLCAMCIIVADIFSASGIWNRVVRYQSRGSIFTNIKTLWMYGMMYNVRSRRILSADITHPVDRSEGAVDRIDCGWTNGMWDVDSLLGKGFPI